MRPTVRFTRNLLAGVLAAASSVGLAQPLYQRDVVNEGSIARWWRLADGVTLSSPSYPKAMESRAPDVCVNIGYMVNKDGSVSDLLLLKFWSSEGEQALSDSEMDAFLQPAAAVMKQWRFARKVDGPVPHPVYTSASMMFFGGKTGADASSIRAHCAIPDLAEFIDEWRNGGDTNRDKLAHFHQRRNFSEVLPTLK
ncbi:hypothetical protein [Arenimonas oryziterrae]|uniref:TonB C-terminal domain-containing protein n=1 Tax=Arenimonas oryziterrae DSM 21050 = YC6267 TaxID=1121015 RepID=A0A091AWB7_9GAMM|nr:hypothetical protein [Arenimonas oryziterrae]KFN43577.1 hypothetical protein N789_09895 [Arenimonas oryziterrae DSM 21050 = YC6267]